MSELKIVVNGAGAAGISIVRLLLSEKVKDIILLDSQGSIYKGRQNLNNFKKVIALKTNHSKIKGGLAEAMVKADVFIGVSKAVKAI